MAISLVRPTSSRGLLPSSLTRRERRSVTESRACRRRSAVWWDKNSGRARAGVDKCATGRSSFWPRGHRVTSEQPQLAGRSLELGRPSSRYRTAALAKVRASAASPRLSRGPGKRGRKRAVRARSTGTGSTTWEEISTDANQRHFRAKGDSRTQRVRALSADKPPRPRAVWSRADSRPPRSRELWRRTPGRGANCVNALVKRREKGGRPGLRFSGP